MHELTIYQVDAFSSKPFKGNPAAVIILKKWLNDDIMQQIAIENNLSETAFIVPSGSDYHIRWFTPGSEVDLCGHATLASGHVFFKHLNYSKNEIIFNSRSGKLKVIKNDDLLTLDFPVDEVKKTEPPKELLDAFNIRPKETFKGKTDYMLIFESEEIIRNMDPDLVKIKSSGARGVIISSKGDNVDFVSRFFAPNEGIDEDPVTGSAHTTLMPYWAKKLNNTHLKAKQLSSRGGDLDCKMNGDRVLISGQAVTFMIGKIYF